MPIPVHKRSRPAGLLLLLLLGAGCAGSGSLTFQHLDPVTGATITRAATPIVMYRDMSANSAFGREYVYIGPIEVNTMGERRHYLWLGIWGTQDNRARSLDDFETVVIYANGEPLTLESEGFTPGIIGASESVYVKPVAAATDAYYRVTTDQIRLLAESPDIELRAGTAHSRLYQLWDSVDSSQSALQEFLRHAN